MQCVGADMVATPANTGTYKNVRMCVPPEIQKLHKRKCFLSRAIAVNVPLVRGVRTFLYRPLHINNMKSLSSENFGEHVE